MVYERLSAASGLMLDGLSARHLLTDEQRSLLVDTKSLMDFFARIAKDELAGRPIADDENERLAFIGDELEALWFRTTGNPAFQHAGREGRRRDHRGHRQGRS